MIFYFYFYFYFIRDAFFTGIQSNDVRQHLLENRTLTLETMFDQARTLKAAQKHSEMYPTPGFQLAAPTANAVAKQPDTQALKKGTCWNCGDPHHARSVCPAREAACHTCGRIGHSKMCMSEGRQPSVASSDRAVAETTAASLHFNPTLASITSATLPALSKSISRVSINGHVVNALIDSGSSDSFIHPDLVSKLALQTKAGSGQVFMASMPLSGQIIGSVILDFKMNDLKYSDVKLHVMHK